MTLTPRAFRFGLRNKNAPDNTGAFPIPYRVSTCAKRIEAIVTQNRQRCAGGLLWRSGLEPGMVVRLSLSIRPVCPSHTAAKMLAGYVSGVLVSSTDLSVTAFASRLPRVGVNPDQRPLLRW